MEFLTIGVQGGRQGSEEINSYLYKFLNENKTIKVNCLDENGFELVMRVQTSRNAENIKKVKTRKASKVLIRKKKKLKKIF